MMRIVTAAVTHLLPAAALISAFFLAMPEAKAQGAFGSMQGNWSGNGTITLQDGSRERIRCRATYAVGDGGNSMNQNLRCASDSYPFALATSVAYNGGTVSGSWTETNRGISGAIDGRGSPGLNKAQQELEFTSVLLSNAVSDLKMLMQIQL